MVILEIQTETFLFADYNLISLYSLGAALTLTHIAYEVLFTIWQGGQLAILKDDISDVKTILGADYTLAMLVVSCMRHAAKH